MIRGSHFARQPDEAAARGEFESVRSRARSGRLYVHRPSFDNGIVMIMAESEVNHDELDGEKCVAVLVNIEDLRDIVAAADAEDALWRDADHG